MNIDEIKVGDRVKVAKEYTGSGVRVPYFGAIGTVVRVGVGDLFPILVQFARDSNDKRWFDPEELVKE